MLQDKRCTCHNAVRRSHKVSIKTVKTFPLWRLSG